MNVLQIHERAFAVPPATLAQFLDSLGSPEDRLWPREHWPAMRFDRPLSLGAVGGHGPIRYTVDRYEPGSLVRFRISSPRGFHGYHAFEVTPSQRGANLRHVLEMRTSGLSQISWPLMFRPLHDALLNDLLHQATIALNLPSAEPRWSLWVRCLRWLWRQWAKVTAPKRLRG